MNVGPFLFRLWAITITNIKHKSKKLPVESYQSGTEREENGPMENVKRARKNILKPRARKNILKPTLDIVFAKYEYGMTQKCPIRIPYRICIPIFIPAAK